MAGMVRGFAAGRNTVGTPRHASLTSLLASDHTASTGQHPHHPAMALAGANVRPNGSRIPAQPSAHAGAALTPAHRSTKSMTNRTGGAVVSGGTVPHGHLGRHPCIVDFHRHARLAEAEMGGKIGDFCLFPFGPTARSCAPQWAVVALDGRRIFGISTFRRRTGEDQEPFRREECHYAASRTSSVPACGWRS